MAEIGRFTLFRTQHLNYNNLLALLTTPSAIAGEEKSKVAIISDDYLLLHILSLFFSLLHSGFDESSHSIKLSDCRKQKMKILFFHRNLWPLSGGISHSTIYSNKASERESIVTI
jgi:hypothetical protein